MEITLIISIIASVFSSKFILPGIINFIKYNTMSSINYKGNTILNSAGIFFTLNLILISSIILLIEMTLNHNKLNLDIIVLLIGILSASFSGYIDDSIAETPKGILSHGKLLFHGKFTGGNIKAIIGVSAAIVISLIQGHMGYSFLINIFTITLMQNFINLLDLRPGRAIKAYSIIFIMYIPFTGLNSMYFIYNLSMVISLLFYMKYELNEISMMGDTGSNILGILLGITISRGNFIFRIVILIFLVFIHFYTEKNSISKLIDNNNILKLIDMFGRKNDV